MWRSQKISKRPAWCLENIFNGVLGLEKLSEPLINEK
jgi:hypothetical protein